MRVRLPLACLLAAPLVGAACVSLADGADDAGGATTGDDAGEVARDDAGTARDDAGAHGEDAGAIGEDAGVVGEDAGDDDAGAADADAGAADADGGALTDGSWRTSIAACLAIPLQCPRVFVMAHGGDWNTSDRPFDSRAAYEQAVVDEADGIETDVRLTGDGVAVIAHSSPIELYESLECAGQRIEEMTADEVTACHLFPSTTETFQRVDDVLANAAGKALVELEVKQPADLPAVISLVIGLGATDRVFFLLGTDEVALLPTLQGGDQVWAMARIRDLAEVPAMLATPRVLMLELDRAYDAASEQDVSLLVTGTIQPAGVRALTSSDLHFATLQNHQEVLAQGFDVVLSYDVPNGVQATQEANLARGLPAY